MNPELSADVRTRLDVHLDAVEQALIASGCSREQRRGIVDDLEAQILDMLAGRSPSPSLADLEAVLASLDPPDAYQSPRVSPPHPPVTDQSPRQESSPNPALRTCPFRFRDIPAGVPSQKEIPLETLRPDCSYHLRHTSCDDTPPYLTMATIMCTIKRSMSRASP